MNMYFIAIVAPEEINEKALKWKNFMKEHFGCQVALKSPAHITLVPPFWMQPALEKELIDAINEFGREMESFSIRLRDFSAFTPRVIFIDVVENDHLSRLQDHFINFLIEKNNFPVSKDTRPFHPHVTIATRDLYKKAFYEAWEIFSKKKYEVSWSVKGISLLRHNKKNWDVIFTSQPIM